MMNKDAFDLWWNEVRICGLLGACRSKGTGTHGVLLRPQPLPLGWGRSFLRFAPSSKSGFRTFHRPMEHAPRDLVRVSPRSCAEGVTLMDGNQGETR
jgi:hypothetical protein